MFEQAHGDKRHNYNRADFAGTGAKKSCPATPD
jgi:hypothetical protein